MVYVTTRANGRYGEVRYHKDLTVVAQSIEEAKSLLGSKNVEPASNYLITNIIRKAKGDASFRAKRILEGTRFCLVDGEEGIFCGTIYDELGNIESCCTTKTHAEMQAWACDHEIDKDHYYAI